MYCLLGALHYLAHKAMVGSGRRMMQQLKRHIIRPAMVVDASTLKLLTPRCGTVRWSPHMHVVKYHCWI
jgi:hypothetical protein